MRSHDLRDWTGKPIGLRKKSSEVLACLAARPGELVTKAEIMAAAWPDVTVTDESLTQCIAEIRKAIGDSGQVLVRTHVGKGYSLDAGAVSRSRPRLPARPLALAAVLAAVAAAFLAWLIWPAPEQDGPTRVAVLAFDDLSPGEDRGYLGDGIAEGIIT